MVALQWKVKALGACLLLKASTQLSRQTIKTDGQDRRSRASAFCYRCPCARQECDVKVVGRR